MVSKKLVAASSGPLVLSILASGESYGYAIIQRVQELSGGELKWTESMLYPVLHRMERDGWVRAEWRTADSGRRRKYYAITTEGRGVQRAALEEWRRVNDILDRALREVPPCTI